MFSVDRISILSPLRRVLRSNRPLLISAFYVLGAMCGCDATPATRNAPDSPASAPVIAPQAADVDAQPGDTKPTDEPSAKSPGPPPPEMPRRGTERILILTPGGPLLCDVTVLLDGQTPEELLRPLVDELLALGKASVAGNLTWKELVELPALRRGQFGQAPLTEAADSQRVIRQFDKNRDNVPDREEIFRFLTHRDRSGRLVELTSHDAASSSDPSTAATWQLLDANHDAVLAADEIAAATQRLNDRKGSADGILTLATIQSANASQGAGPNSAARLPMAVVLDADTNWESAWRMIGATYPGWRSARTPGAARMSQLLAPLDRNNNGRLTAAELAGLCDIASHLRITTRFAGANENPSAAAEVAIEAAASNQDWLIITVDPAGNCASLAAEGLVVDWRLVGQTPQEDTPAVVAAAQFKKLDRDEDGFLDQSEWSAADDAQPSFEVLDLNGDEQVDEGEYRTLLARRRLLQAAKCRLAVDRAEDALFTALDADHDGALGEREVNMTAQRLTAYDVDQDGNLVPGEIPARIIVSLQQGPAAENPSPRDNVRELVRARMGPAWFRHMDRNRDGDLSPGEFLGNAARFGQLDTDQDGYISVEEAQQAASK